MAPFDSERWRRLSDLLDAALDQPSARREAWLDEHCDGDETLRAELVSLLRSADSTEAGDGSPLDASIAARAPDLIAHGLSDPLQGKQMGSYRLGDEIGRGGMGVVYAAERSDGQFERRVVVKLLAAGMDSPETRQRFLLERHILADLDHPNIARLIDGGVTDDGRPYFVMERVDGQQIDLYCDRNRLSIENRIRLFLEVVEAIHHAHRHLIVHRDIKPSNVLVTEEGRAKLLDFGIAKLLGDSKDAAAVGLTQTGGLLLTPEFASPEQVRMEAITTASDIYQLGALLYTLLTGRAPHELSTRSPVEVARVVCDDRIERPSEAAGKTSAAAESGYDPARISLDRGASAPAKLRRALSGDLDRIVLKALHKEPERRYASAEQLADDLRRYLGGRPVLAHGDSPAYRFRKYARRHRWGFATAAAVVVLTLGFGVYHTLRVTAERDRAQQESVQRAEMSEFLVDLFQLPESPELRGQEITARQLLERGIERLESTTEDRPETRIRLLGVVGQASTQLGLYDEARPALTEALELSREVFGDGSIEVADAAYRLAMMYQSERNFYPAMPLVEEALVIRRDRLAEDDILIITTLRSVARNHRETGQLEQSEAEMREALELLKRHHPDNSLELTRTRGDLAFALRGAGNYEEAEPLYREVIEELRALGPEEGESLPAALNNLAYLLRLEEEYEEAVELYRESLALQSASAGPSHPTSLMIRGNLSSALQQLERWEEAEEELRIRLELTIQSQPEGHWRVGAAHRMLARVQFRTERFDEAEEHYRAAASIWTDSIGEDHTWTATARAEQAACLVALGRVEESEPLFEASKPALLTEKMMNDPSTRYSIEPLIAFYEGRGHPERVAFYEDLLAKNAAALAEQERD